MMYVDRQDARDVFIRTLNRIADENSWTTEALARNGLGVPINPRARNAVQWSLAGALQRELDGHRTLFKAGVISILIDGMGTNLVNLNDGPDGHKAVVALLAHRIHILDQELLGKRL